MLKSRAVLSSGLLGMRGKGLKKGEVHDIDVINIHLSATEDETLLWRGNTGLLLNFFLDPGDLQQEAWASTK